MSRFLHLKSLKLRNFKGVAELDLAFDASLTLLAGVNGVGKTSVMQALLAAVTRTWDIIVPGGYPKFPFEENVVRAGSTDATFALELDVPCASPVEVRCPRPMARPQVGALRPLWRNRTEHAQPCQDFVPITCLR